MSLPTTSPLSEDWAIPATPKPSESEFSIPIPAPLGISSPDVRSIIDKTAIVPQAEKSATSTPNVNFLPIRHSKYYIDEQMAIFLVDNHLYKVHRHFLRQESLKFDELLDHLPPGQSGETDESPIVLPEVTRGEIEALLEHFYAGLLFKAPEKKPHALRLQEYIDLLSIATRYECTDARKKAIVGIESVRPNAVQRIVLAEKFNVPSWLEPAYVEICKRDKSLELFEGEQLGLEKAILIARAREEIRAKDGKPGNNLLPPAPQAPLPAGLFAGKYPEPLPVPVPPSESDSSRVNRIVKEIFFSGRKTISTYPQSQPSNYYEKAPSCLSDDRKGKEFVDYLGGKDFCEKQVEEGKPDWPTASPTGRKGRKK